MKRVAGVKQTQKALENGKAKHIFVALDADEKLREKIIILAEEKGVSITYAESMVALGKDCGIQVPSAAAADICD